MTHSQHLSDLQISVAGDDPRTHGWEPSYGFVATDKVQLALALEAVRRQVCAYGSFGDRTCDCKYGIQPEIDLNYSERTGCPELRSAIYHLLHGDDQ